MSSEKLKNRPRILFIAEAVTLAHVGRTAALANSLDKTRYEVHVAQCPRYRDLLDLDGVVEHEITSVSPQQFMQSLAAGKPLYSIDQLDDYIKEELQLFEQIRPDVVVGDFRISLGISAALAAVPYVTISNACWSPYARQRFIVPELPLTRFLGPRLGQMAFDLGRPIAFAYHALPMHILRRRYGRKSLGLSLQRTYTVADFTLYADFPGLYEMRNMPPEHRFIGPVNWAPTGQTPDWWGEIPADLPVVYATLGSSGPGALLPVLLSVLAGRNLTALVSTAGVKYDGAVPENVYMEDYLPGDLAAQRADMVICNGGSPTTQQALCVGKPVVGIANNLDQYLNMATIERAGAGISLRSGTLDARRLSSALDRLLSENGFRSAAQRFVEQSIALDGKNAFSQLIDEIT